MLDRLLRSAMKDKYRVGRGFPTSDRRTGSRGITSKLATRLRPRSLRPIAGCTHLATVHVTELPEPVLGCEECLKTGSRWMHLRMCLECGKIGCCDQSPNRHATAHFHESDHPLIRSAEPGEDWAWCYVDELALGLSPG